MDHAASFKILTFQLVLFEVLGPTLSLPVLVGPLALGQGPERPIEAFHVHGPGIVGLVTLLAHMVGLAEIPRDKPHQLAHEGGGNDVTS